MNFTLTKPPIKTGFLPSLDQTQLFYRHYPVKGHKAAVLLVHGFGEHSGRYAHVIDKLRENGIAVWSIDLRGHGHSTGTKGDVLDFVHFEDDVLAALRFVSSTEKGVKKFILAHSMGALVAIRLASRERLPIDGLVLSCPLLALKMPVHPLKKFASNLLRRFVPNLRVKSGIKGPHLSSDENFSKAYDNDPLVLKNLSIRAFFEISKGFRSVHQLAEKFSLSLFMQVAGADPVVCPDAAINWFHQVDHKQVDATIKVYPEFLHEIYNESKRHEAIDDLVSWLKDRI